jgi:hypothetical protein
MFVDVVAHVTWLPVVDEALLDWCHLLASRLVFLVDRNLSFSVFWINLPFCGCPSMSGG